MKASCTLTIITKNGEATIARCLESALDSRCFEYIIVLLDTKSTDSTGRIISEYQSRHPGRILIIGHRWKTPPDFAEARNKTFDYAGMYTDTAYVSWLDDDEIISDPNGFLALLRKARGEAYNVWVVSPLEGGGFHNMYQPRLVPLRWDVRFECPVFERIDFALRRAGVPMIATDLEAIYHDGYLRGQEVKFKNVRNLSVLREYLKLHKKKTEQRGHLAEQHYRMTGKLAGILKNLGVIFDAESNTSVDIYNRGRSR